jgi:predicted metalloprotease
MRWEGQEESDNVEDRRGMRLPGGAGAGLGCGGVLLVLVISLLTGKDPTQLLQLLQQSQPAEQQQTGPAAPAPPPNDRQAAFARTVLKSTEVVWTAIFAKSGQRYEKPTLVLFDGEVASACGNASSAVGPFYCPADRKLYLDFSFFAELDQKFGAPGEFAQAYVIAHEIGHHVQNLLGIADQVTEAQQRAGRREANALSVGIELQADCLAGVWAVHANETAKWLDPGDVESALKAAAAIGDDRLQKMSRGYVQPESWTHGSSEQRVTWLRRGMQTGEVSACKTL